MIDTPEFNKGPADKKDLFDANKIPNSNIDNFRDKFQSDPIMNTPPDRSNSSNGKIVDQLITTNELLRHLLDRMDYICDRLSPKEGVKED